MTDLAAVALHDLFYAALGALYVLAAWNCWRILGQRLSSGAAIAWITIHVVFPFVGVPLYFLVGNQRIRGYVRRHRRAAAAAAQGEQLLDRLPPSPTPENIAPECQESYQTFRRVFSSFGPVFQPQRASVQLLIDGETTFEAIFEAIRSAQRYILVQYYILRSDRLGLELKELLVDKARSGVHVFLLYDDMGSLWLSRQYIRDLRAAGVHVERFLPIASFKRFFQLNFRNHRKLVIVDGQVAFTGGLNVGEEYASSRLRAAKLKNATYWRDTHVRLQGPSVTQLEDVFLEDWFFATDERLDEKVVSRRRPTPPEPGAGESQAVVQVIPSGPTDPFVVPLLLLLQLINGAKHRLWIATPYFVPDQVLIRSLELAIFRGVDVRLMLPLSGDNPIVHWVSLSFAEQLQATGARVLLFEAGFMHQKAIVVDDTTAAIGTMNIDNRALYLNFETTVLVHDPDFAAEMDATLKRDFLSCRYYARPKHRILKHFYRLRANAARLAAPIL